MRSLVSREDVCDALASVIGNPAHPDFVKAYKMAAEFGYGRATQPLEHTGEGGGPISVSITHTVVDPSPNAG